MIREVVLGALLGTDSQQIGNKNPGLGGLCRKEEIYRIRRANLIVY